MNLPQKNMKLFIYVLCILCALCFVLAMFPEKECVEIHNNPNWGFIPRVATFYKNTNGANGANSANSAGKRSSYGNTWSYFCKNVTDQYRVILDGPHITQNTNGTEIVTFSLSVTKK